MSKQYELTRSRRMTNRFVAFMAKRGKGPAWQLTTTGRKSGERRHVMVTPVTVDGIEYLVAPYGSVSWVLNLRASDRATLARGAATSRVRAIEVDGEEAGKALARYYNENTKYVADYFELAAHPTIVDFTRVTDQHPVFRVEHPM
ncbi:MAG: nitroreductase family deazaflavin-dependent oxidoreductase [Acidimicrobiia bacterium]|nr:MAG: nitroreductase family deazaflavin-dependent oxidoreductase [Acidimicrobiia bacterium]